MKNEERTGKSIVEGLWIVLRLLRLLVPSLTKAAMVHRRVVVRIGRG
jgi:hypothetical protein